MTPADLRAFTARIAERVPEIRAPVHLSGGAEEQLCEYFAKHHRPGDWVFSTWRAQYHALLAGVPEAEVEARVLAGKSITLCFPEARFFTSAIVGGHLPIALGVAMGIRRNLNISSKHSQPRVHVFLGDMAATTGTFHECLRYAEGHRLLISFVIEDNGISVCTPTDEVWGERTSNYIQSGDDGMVQVHRIPYHLPHPHSGVGEKRTQF